MTALYGLLRASSKLWIIFGAAALLGVVAIPAAADEPLPGAATLFHVEAPAPHTVLTNGTTIAISGWTAGSRVDVYLDGPPGIGTGIGTAAETGARADVATAMGTDRDYRGFAVAYLPTMLSIGEHVLYAYTLVDGAWVMEIVPIVGAGNVLPPERMNDGGSMM